MANTRSMVGILPSRSSNKVAITIIASLAMLLSCSLLAPIQGFQASRPLVATTNKLHSPLPMPSLGMALGGGDDTSSSSSSSSSINLSLIVQNLANQVLIGLTIWTGGSGYDTLVEHAHLDANAVLLGVAGTVPMLALSRAIETSESPFVSGLNLSTNMAVLNLFGPKARPVLVAGVTAVLASVTGVVEETVFRGQSLPAFTNQLGDGDILTGALFSTLLFAVLHTNPLGFFKSPEAFVDNSTLLVLQIINGATFCFLYIATNNLAVPIITHALYDFYTFYKTHLVDVAGQMEYAKREALMPRCSSSGIEKKWTDKRGEEWLAEAKQSFYLMDTDMDGTLSRKELRIAMYSYGVYLSEAQSEEVKRAADTDSSGSIDFDEYLEYIGPGGSRYKAVRYTLFGQY
eukprot:CAMPEP_0196139290 /NCGR_PEP_ID=MMETSP0910-20130528/6616_1 /TAXON_ID=49265 /ORGANISM="Thalassiosira rotula, Strain GSO102" /LENGTH=402 /DNA_ID=CAMNT_0041399997 /DNA_START=51 /DNA_END=1259 /DNA_ORIENTATION=+